MPSHLHSAHKNIQPHERVAAATGMTSGALVTIKDQRAINCYSSMVVAMTEQASPERRSSPRQRAYLRGRLFFNNRLNVVDCMVRDISDRGARLIYSEAVATPDELELYIPQKDQTFNVRTVWRRDKEAGVAFEMACQIDRPLGASEIDERFARLEAEIAALKRTLRKLKPGPDSDPDAA
jgi:hypothetical protein